jgi:uncharacterized glyoxalase superfamily protein PhnB
MAKRPTLGSSVIYQDPIAALAWLAKAFGFEQSMLITDGDGKMIHSEMTFGDGYVMVGSEFSARVRSPKSGDGKNTQCVHIHLDDELRAHCERARAAGAVIVQEPQEQFYGDLTYYAADPEGHLWTFSQTVRVVTREQAQAAIGAKIEGWM